VLSVTDASLAHYGTYSSGLRVQPAALSACAHPRGPDLSPLQKLHCRTNPAGLSWGFCGEAWPKCGVLLGKHILPALSRMQAGRRPSLMVDLLPPWQTGVRVRTRGSGCWLQAHVLRSCGCMAAAAGAPCSNSMLASLLEKQPLLVRLRLVAVCKGKQPSAA
jgi:hypothetical protein